MKRGYFGIGIYHPKTEENLGTLWRSAHNFGANFIFTIGNRYKKQKSATTYASRHVPLYHYKDYEDFKSFVPEDCELVFVEQTQGARDLVDTHHPERGIYILGAEDIGIPEDLMRGHRKIYIDTPLCLNVAVAGSITMFHRTSWSTGNSLDCKFGGLGSISSRRT